jgi:hypothetical protein
MRDGHDVQTLRKNSQMRRISAGQRPFRVA